MQPDWFPTDALNYHAPQDAVERVPDDIFSFLFLASEVFGIGSGAAPSSGGSAVGSSPGGDVSLSSIVDLSAPEPREYGRRRPAKVHIIRTEREWAADEGEATVGAVHAAVRALFEDHLFHEHSNPRQARGGSIVRMRSEFERVTRAAAHDRSMRSGKAWDEYAARTTAALRLLREGAYQRGVDEYIAAAREVIPLQVVLTESFTVICPVCEQKMTDESEVDVEGNDGKSTCKCGREIASVSRCFVYKDHTRFDTTIKNSYNDLTNFIKRIDMFEGKQKTFPPNFLFSQLEEWFDDGHAIEGYASIAEIRAAPLNEFGKKDGTTVRHIEEALSATENSAFYKDIELIGKQLFGWRLADLGQLRNRIITDYISTQRVYEEVKERESSLNVNLRLFFHLTARGHPCRLEDFKTVTSNESLRYHRRMIETMAERTGLTNYTPF